MANVLVLYRSNPTHHVEVVATGADTALVRQSAPWMRRGRAPRRDSDLGFLDEGCLRIPAELVEEGSGQ
jgi:predicted 2-oxoglutarate/Fe(II)-dependent dioxygenase YbiX